MCDYKMFSIFFDTWSFGGLRKSLSINLPRKWIPAPWYKQLCGKKYISKYLSDTYNMPVIDYIVSFLLPHFLSHLQNFVCTYIFIDALSNIIAIFFKLISYTISWPQFLPSTSPSHSFPPAFSPTTPLPLSSEKGRPLGISVKQSISSCNETRHLPSF